MWRRWCIRVGVVTILGMCVLLELFLSDTARAVKEGNQTRQLPQEQGIAASRIGNMQIDERSGYPISLYNVGWATQSPAAEETAWEYLRAHKTVLGIVSIADLTMAKAMETPGGTHIRFRQEYAGLPVKHGVIVVSLNRNNRVAMVLNHYKHGLEGTATAPLVSEDEALDTVADDLAGGASLKAALRARLIIFQQPDTRAGYLAWEVRVPGRAGFGSWEYLIDAVTGAILVKQNMMRYYIDGTARVFDPDPRTTLNDDTLMDQEDSNYPELADAYFTVDLLDLNDPVMTDSLEYRIQGRWARSESLHAGPETPTGIRPVVSGSCDFLCYRDSTLFTEVNVYYHIDNMKRYIGDSLGFTHVMDFPIRFDANNFVESNAAYDAGDTTLHFGLGCVDFAEDADVILHEYCHAIGFDIVSEFKEGHMRFLAEGYSDYLAVSYSRTKNPSFYPDRVGTWVGFNPPPCWPGRTLSDTLRYPDDCVYGPWGDPHEPGGLLWASSLIDMEEALGNRDIATSLVIKSMHYLAPGALMPDAAEAILDADRSLYNGAHLGLLVKVFALRGYFPVVQGRTYGDDGWIEPVYVTGDVTMQGTFRIWPGVIVAVADGSDDTEGGIDPDRIELYVTGHFRPVAGDTSVISFVSAGQSPSPGDWYGIVTGASCGTLEMDNCEVSHAEFGVQVRNDDVSIIEKTNFTSNATTHLDIFADADIDVINCNFEVDSPYGILIQNSSSPSNTVVDSCTIIGTGNATHGISVSGGGPTLSNNIISGFTTGRGIRTHQSSSPTMSGNSISDCKYGIRCEGSSGPSVGDASSVSSIVDCTSGIYTEDTSSPDVNGVEIDSCTVGIETRDSSDPDINDDNIISFCTTGLYAKDTSQPYVRKTVFDSCTTNSVEVTFSAEPDLGTISDFGNNSFYKGGNCPTYRHVKATKERPIGVGDVMAEKNWWGTSSPPSNCFVGMVDYDPWLSSDPNSAKPEQGVTKEILTCRPALWQNSPNPFTGTTLISYQVPNPGADVTLRVYDAVGRLVKTLVDERREPGPHEVMWTGFSNNGKIVPSGVYFYEIEIGDDFRASKKMSLVR